MYACAHVGMSVCARHECVHMCVKHEIKREFRMNENRDDRLKWGKRTECRKRTVR